VTYSGETGMAPLTRTAIVGSKRTIHTPSPQGRATFQSWSDGGAQQHDITVGAADTTYTATFLGGSAGSAYKVLYDVNKDGKADAGILRPTNPQGPLWYVPYTGGGQLQLYFGVDGDAPVMADYDGDGTADPVIYRPSNALWYGLGQGGTVRIIQEIMGG